MFWVRRDAAFVNLQLSFKRGMHTIHLLVFISFGFFNAVHALLTQSFRFSRTFSRFGFAPGTVELYAEKVATRGLCAIAQAESLRYKLTGGLAVRRACYGVLRFIMESGAKGCEVVVSGKLRGQRAKSMKFTEGLMIHSGDPCNVYVDTATRHVLLRQGVLGIKVKIMLPYDPNGKSGPKKPLPDNVTVIEPKEEQIYEQPETEYKVNIRDIGAVDVPHDQVE